MRDGRRTILLVLGGLLLWWGLEALATTLGIVPPPVQAFLDLLSRAAGPIALIVLGLIVVIAAGRGDFHPELPGPGARLYRGRPRVLAGVCAGLAGYLGVDPLLVRLAFVLFAIVTHGVTAIVVYLVLAIVIPEPPAEGVQHA